MTNKTIEALINEVGTDISGKWISVEAARLLVERTVKECVETSSRDAEGYVHGGQWYHGVYAGNKAVKVHFGLDT